MTFPEFWRNGRDVLRASLAGALLGAVLTGLLVIVDARMNPTGGPLDFGSPGFVLAAAGIALAVGLLVSFACLALVVSVFGVARLTNWRTLPAALVGGAAGLLVIALLYAAAWREAPKWPWLLIGGFEGASVAAFWARWTGS